MRRRPRVGLLGVGWIGRHRLSALVEADAVDVVAVADPDAEACRLALAVAPGARAHDGLGALLELDLDGLAIATPSALHAAQATRALDAGLAVFCQKPLARTAAEARAVVAAARRADRLLAVDLSYRHTEALRALRTLVDGGALGRVYALELVFHNAYGPDKAWFYDRGASGGGCAMDLGTHLVDAGLGLLGFPRVERVDGRLFARGERLAPGAGAVEDHALARLDLEGGAVMDVACSWRLSAGADAVIAVRVHGTEGGAEMRNVDGSFYDFVLDRFRGTSRERCVSPPDAWGGRAAVAWAGALAAGAGFDPEVARAIDVAAVLDQLYGVRA